MEIRRCQHIKTNGQQCGSPALRGATVCYFHGRLGHTQHLTINQAGYYPSPSPETLTLPVLEDYESVQMAIMQVLQKLTTGHLDSKTAGLLLYGLQIASSNLRYARFDPRAETVVIDVTATHLTPLDGDQWSEQEEDEDEDKSENAEDYDDEDGDEEDLNEELADNAELQQPVRADAPVRGPQSARGWRDGVAVRPRAERSATPPTADSSQLKTRKDEPPRISDAQFFQALANLCDHRENGTPLKFPVYPARPSAPRGADIPVREKHPPVAIGSGTNDNGKKTSGG